MVAPAAGDERHSIALPGLASLHSHAFQRGMAGLAELRGDSTDTFWTWRETMYRFALAMTPDDVAAVATLLYVEMLEQGFTHVGEFHYLHHDRDGSPYADLAEMAVRIAQRPGFRHWPHAVAELLCAWRLRRRRAACRTAPLHLLGRSIREVDGRFAQGRQQIVGRQYRHRAARLRAVTPDQLAAIIPLADGGPVHIHAAEQVKEVEDCLAWSGRRPVQWLLEHAPVDQRWCPIHATHTTNDELDSFARSGAVAGLCPVTEASLGDGIFPAREFVGAGGAFGIGTDSNVLVGVADELRQLEYGQRLKHRERNVLSGGAGASTGRVLFDHALAGGAQALGSRPLALAGRTWRIVTLDTAHPSLAGRSRDAVIDGWFFTAARRDRLRLGRRQQGVEGGRHKLRRSARENFNVSVRRLVA